MAEPDLNEMERRLRSMGIEADAGDLDPGEIETPGDGADLEPAAAVETAAGGEVGAGEQAAAAEVPPVPPVKAAPEQSVESPYQKARREAGEREAAARREIEQERAQVKAEREALEHERRNASQGSGTKQAQAPAAGDRDEHGYTSQDYEQAASSWEDDGDIEMARAARKRAGEMRQAEETRRQHEQQHDFSRRWWETVRDQLAAVPDLKDQASPLGKAVQEVLRTKPALSLEADGFRHAVEIAQAKLAAGEVPVLRSELDRLKAENQRLIKLTAVTATPPARGAGSEDGRDLSERDLRRLAAEADGQ